MGKMKEMAMSEETNYSGVQGNNIFDDSLPTGRSTVAEESEKEAVAGEYTAVTNGENVSEVSSANSVYDPNVPLAELEKQYIVNSLAYFQGNKVKAANALGITVKTLYNKLHKYGMMSNAKNKG